MEDNLDPQKWYNEREPLYRELLNVAEVLLERLLSDKGIPHLGIEKRVKQLKSLIEKMDRRGYNNLEQVNDLAGLRIIGFILSDTSKDLCIWRTMYRWKTILSSVFCLQSRDILKVSKGVTKEVWKNNIVYR